MPETEKHGKHVRVLFRTTHYQYALAETKSFSIPGDTGPVELNDIINALLSTSSPKVYMNFFIGESMVYENIESAIDASSFSTEDIIEIYYSPRTQPKLIAALPHDDWISSITVVSDSLVLTGSYDFSIRMNRVDLHEPSTIAKSAAQKGAITDTCFMEDTNEISRCATASQDGSVLIWDYSKDFGFSATKKYFPHHSSVNAVRYSKKHASLLSAGNDGLVCLWSPERTHSFSYFRGHTRAVTDIRFSEHEMLSGSMDGTMKIWNMETFQEIFTIDTRHGVFCLDMKNDERLVLSGSANCAIDLTDFRARKSCFSVRGHTKWIYSVIFGDNQQFLSASEDKSLCLWDMRYIKTPLYRDQSIHSDAVLALAHCQGQRYLSAGKDRRLVVLSFD